MGSGGGFRNRWHAGVGVLAAAIALASPAAAAPRPEHCALYREDVKAVIASLDAYALTKAARGNAAYYAIKREGYRELSRSLAEHRAKIAAAMQTPPTAATPAAPAAPAAAPESSAAPAASPAALPYEPRICFDVTRMPGRITPGDAAPASQKALDELVATLAEQMSKELPKLHGKETKMVNGSVPASCENLDAVAIVNARDQLVCSGLLVDRRHVLSAAHCVCQLGSNGGTVVLGETVDANSPGPGRRRATAPIDPTGTRTPVADPCLSSERRRGADIALFQLTSDLKADASCAAKPLTARIAPIAAALQPAVSTVRVAGFGRTEQGTNGQKLYAHIGVYSRICGPELISRRFNCVPGRETVLIDPAGLRDSCGGDSGGPAYIKSGTELLAYAITSRGLPGGECRSGGIYTLITPSVVGWMRRNGVEVEVRE